MTTFQFPGATGAERAHARFSQMIRWGFERCGQPPSVRPRQMQRRNDRKTEKAHVAEQRREAMRTRHQPKPRSVMLEA